MLSLFLAIGTAVLVSFLCSLAESSLYAISWSSIELLRKEKQKAGKLIYKMRANIDKPIAAILILNTLANTAGSTIAGAAFLAVFGSYYMAFFAVGFTFLILTFGEIVPKTIGVAYPVSIMRIIAIPLDIIIRVMTPVLWLTSLITKLLSPGEKTPQISEDDIRAITSLSRQAGRIKPYEENFVRNVLALDQKRVYSIMTPRTVVFSLPADLTIEKACKDSRLWHFSRIPVFGEDNEDLVGLVERRTIARCLAENKGNDCLSQIMRPIFFVQESQTLDALLQEMLKARVHLFAVLDEYGGLEGVVSLEDIMEEILGREIMDESDKVEDLRALARDRRKSLTIKQKL